MNESSENDFILSHSLLNYLHAQYRAHYAFINALQTLKSPDVTKEIVKRTQTNLTLVSKWNQDLYAGMPLLSSRWKYPESFESQNAFELLDELRGELKKINDIIKEISSEPDPLIKPEDLVFMISANIRYVYGRENFIKGIIELGKYKNNKDLIDYHSMELAYATTQIKNASAMMKEYLEKGDVSKEHFEELKDLMGTLHCLFSSNIHDINYYKALYAPEFTFEHANFSQEEAIKWKAINLDPNSAGYWRSYEFNVEDARTWISFGFENSCLAYAWRKNGFKPEEALNWIGLRVIPKEARKLLNNGITAEMHFNNLKKQSEKSAA